MMILHGGRLSPFVRRVALWLAAQERPFERRLVSVFEADFGGLGSLNPLGRVPVLTDNDLNLFETSAIIDYLEETAPAAKKLIADSGPQRWQALQAIGLSHGIAEKAVALVYESDRRPAQLRWPDWQERIALQIRHGLAALDQRLSINTAPSDGTGIAAVCAYDLVACRFPELVSPDLTNLLDLSARANTLAAFADTHPRLA